jgi:tetratricopeptide (TPR) repeat protein
MRLRAAAALALALAAPAFAQAQSPAESRIAAARKAIAAQPEVADGYNQLAMALARRARETADPDFYRQADEAVQASLRIAPDNLEAEKARVWILLGKHEFAQALAAATALNQRVPDDVTVYGMLVDANAELGNYAAAEKAAQWMLDLRAGNVAALTRAAYLRELFGDVDGALGMMRAAHDRTPPHEVEDRAWILAHVSHLHLAAGRVDLAQSAAEAALGLFPDYHYALAQLAKVRLAQGRAGDAVVLLERRYALAPHPENLYAVGEALAAAGRKREGARAMREFEGKARAEMTSVDNANRDLVLYYVDHARKPRAALAVAQLEIARRRDVFTREAYAWALSASGRHAEARAEIEQALAVGIKDADMLYRAGAIALRRGDRKAAAHYFGESLAASKVSASAPAAQAALRKLEGAAVATR